MKSKIVALALIFGIPFAGSALAQQSTAPGQQMHDKGSVKGSPGASGYAPGQKMQDKGSVKGTTGASGYAPGQQDKSATGKEGMGAKSR
jgi:hypothetical protein